MEDFTPDTAEAANVLSYLGQRITGVDQTVRDQVGALIQQGADLGLSPWQIANGTTPAWSEANGVYGQIPEGWKIDPKDPDQGGHATAMTAYEPRAGIHWFPFVNSWGMDFGWKGTAVLSWDEWCREHAPVGDGPYQFVFPHEFKDFDGWRKYIIRKYA